MDLKSSIMLIVLITIIGKSSSTAVWTLIHDVVQNNVAGLPVVHQNTEWDFDPEQGKQRRARYESLNGKYGENLVERLGMGMGFKGPWGVEVSNVKKSDLRYV